MTDRLRKTGNALCAALTAAVALAGCTGDVDDLYAHEAAYLYFKPVTAVAPLYTALNSTGMFCIIRLGTSQFLFTGSDGTTATYSYTSIVSTYRQPDCIAGFVVGISSIPDLNMQMQPVAYDLVCPTCYEESSIERSLTFTAAEELTCSRCSRVYDLTNGGIIKEGDEGTKLYRYHLMYSAAQDVLNVYN